MKIAILPLIFLVACSTTKESSKKESKPSITNESFKKEKALTRAQLPDYYPGSMAGLNPALQDETLDRFSVEELKSVNTSGDPLIEIAIRCARRDFDGAFAVANNNFDKYQKIPTYWNQLANCHLNNASPRKALLFYNKALEVQKNYVPALNNIGVLYAREGQDQKAQVAFERANKQNKFAKTPRYNLGKLYLKYGLVDLALPIFQSLLKETPGDVDLLNSVATAHFLQSDYRQAWNYYQNIPQNQWRAAEIGLNLTLTLKKLNNEDSAQKVFKDIAKPGTRELQEYYAVVRTQLGAK